MTIFRYYCIVCKFVVHTLGPWQGQFFECPSCHKNVELRSVPDEERQDVKGFEDKAKIN